MPSIASLAGRLAQVALIGPAMARMKRRAVRAIVGGILVGVCGAIGVAYLLIALRTELERQIGPLWAPLAIGAAFVVLAGIAYLALMRPRESEAAQAAKQASAMRDRIAEPARKLEGQVAGNPWQSIAVAAALGFAAAFLSRYLPRRGRRARAEGDARPDDGGGDLPEWRQDAVLRETERRRADGKGA